MPRWLESNGSFDSRICTAAKATSMAISEGSPVWLKTIIPEKSSSHTTSCGRIHCAARRHHSIFATMRSQTGLCHNN